MPRTYSRGACNRCKLRRKKCTEERPVCQACAKWHWTCVYTSPESTTHPSTTTAGPGEVAPEPVLARPPVRRSCCENDIEHKLLSDVPTAIKAFYSPISTTRIMELRTLWQLAINNDLLRHAIVACFSQIAADPAALTKLHRMTYGKALSALKTRVLCEDLDDENVICVVASIVFLGKLESFGSSSMADPLDHWMGLIPLLSSERVVTLTERGSFPRSENLLIFESLIYHVGTHALFSNYVDRAEHLWRVNKTFQRISDMNPPGPDRLKFSPLLCGQYELYQMAFQVTRLFQHGNRCQLTPSKVDEMLSAVVDKQQRLGSEFATLPADWTHKTKRLAERDIYHFFCVALQICILALPGSSAEQQNKLKCLVPRALDMFLKLPQYSEDELLVYHAGHFMLAAIWPIQILACAMRDVEEFRIFETHYDRLETQLDPGHRKRARVLVTQVSDLLRDREKRKDSGASVFNSDGPLPPAMELLRRPIQLASAT